MCKKYLGGKKRVLLMLVGFILVVQCLFVSAAMAVVYVDSNATGVGDGSSWADAYTDLQVGINSAVAEDVWVASGTYMPTLAPYIPGGTDRFLHFALKNGVAVYGGFDGTDNNFGGRDVEVNLTYLSGDIGVPGDSADNCYHVFFHDNDTGDALNTTAILDGFIITGGNADHNTVELHKNGGGMYNHETSPTIRYCTFTANSSSASGWSSMTGGGGGMHNYWSSPVISHCVFENNTAARNGGGILNWYGTPQILSSTFSNNTAANNGGAIHNYTSNVIITDSTVNDNTAYREGGGITNISSSPILTNCTFDNNVITNGSTPMTMYNGSGGAGMPASNAIITNCTFRGNNSSGSAMYSYNSSPIVKNSIFRTGVYSEIRNQGGTTTVTYSVLTDITSFPGNGNSADDPLLDANGLQDNSGPVKTVAIGVGGSAEDSGTATGAPLTDARGVERQSPPSIGAYELISYPVGGEVTGLNGTNEIVLQNNGGDNKEILINTIYAFTTAVEVGKAYDVTVLTQPSGGVRQLCTAEGSGTITDSAITDANVLCVNTYTVGGTISGLANTVVLQNNSGDNLTVSAGDTDFTFTTALAAGSTYSVTVLTNPDTPNQVCTVSTGSGSNISSDVSSVSIACVTTTYTVGGTISGLAGNQVVLQNNAGDDLILSNNDPFTFATAIDDGSDYLVTVLTNPESPNQTCNVNNETGTVNGNDVTTVSVSCTTNTYSIGGTVTGLASGNSLWLANGGVTTERIDNGSSILFDLIDGTSYEVTVSTQPTTPNQTCSLTNASGIVAGTNITDIDANCVTTTYTIGGSVNGLADGNEVVIQNNSGDNLTLSSNDVFTFVTAIDDGSNYTVTVLTDPDTPDQTCTVVSNGSGTLAGGDVTNVSITCVTTTYTVGGSITGLVAGNGVVLQNNSGDDLTVDADGNFTFATAIDDESDYFVTVLTDPTTPSQTCTISNDSGKITGDNVSTVSVNCVTNTYTVGGVVSGLFATNSVTLQNNNGDDLTVDANGTFTFATALDDGSAYTVTILTQPETIIQTCTVINGDSKLAGIDVDSVHINCGTFPWNLFLPAILNTKP